MDGLVAVDAAPGGLVRRVLSRRLGPAGASPPEVADPLAVRVAGGALAVAGRGEPHTHQALPAPGHVAEGVDLLEQRRSLLGRHRIVHARQRGDDQDQDAGEDEQPQ
jgi:hypothetical protein